MCVLSHKQDKAIREDGLIFCGSNFVRLFAL